MPSGSPSMRWVRWHAAAVVVLNRFDAGCELHRPEPRVATPAGWLDGLTVSETDAGLLDFVRG